MGLGKTLEMIALMASDSKLGGLTNKTTLIVAPLGVMSNWSGQVNSITILVTKIDLKQNT